MTSDDLRLMKEEIRRQVNIILNAETGATSTQTETINSLFPGMAGITDRPVMHPFGFVSRAVQGTISVIVRVGDHIGNRMTIGHRDKNRPSDIAEGECAIYSVGKYQVRILNDKVMLGKDGDFETAVVGETLATLLGEMLMQISIHKHICSVPGSFGAPPDNAAQFVTEKENFIDNQKILAKDGGRF